MAHALRRLTAGKLPLTLVGLLACPLRPVHGQPARRDSMPSAWIQLRGGTDNAGLLPGTLRATWHFDAPRPVRGMAVAGGLVVLGTESADADAAPNSFKPDQRGFVIALDAASGRQLWSRPVASWIHGDPVIYHGRVVTTFGRWPMTHPGGATAFDLATGDVVWSFVADAGMMPGPAIDTIAGSVLATGGDGILYSFDLTTGKRVYQKGLASADAMSSPRISGNEFILGAANTVSSYSADRGDRVWSLRVRALEDFGDVPVALSDSIVFVTGTSRVDFWKATKSLAFRRFIRLAREAHQTKKLSTYRNWFREQWLVAIRRRDGTLLWRRPLGIGLEVPRNTSGTPTLVGNRVIVSSPVSKIVSAFDVASGTPLWSRQLDAVHKGAVTVANGEVLFGDKSGTMLILRLTDGAEVGRCGMPGAFTPFAPVVVGQTVFAATRDGSVYALPYDSLKSRASRRAGSCVS